MNKAQKKYAAHLSTLGGAVATTLRDWAIEHSDLHVAAGYGWDMEGAAIEELVEQARETATWRDSAQRTQDARKSEIRQLIKGAPFLGDACRYFMDETEHDTDLNRKIVLWIGRRAVEYVSAEDVAIAALAEFDKEKKPANQRTQEEKLIAGLQAARTNCKGSAMLADFDKFLKKHKLFTKVTKK